MGKEKSLDNLKNGVKFGEGQAINLAGRPKSYINQVWELMGITKDEDKVVLLSKEDKYKFIQGLFEMPLDQLQELANNTKLPVFVVTIVRALICDIADGKTFTIQQFFDRFYGRAGQSLELTGEPTKPLVTIVKVHEDVRKSDKIE